MIRRLRRRRKEDGYVAVFTAVLFAALFSGLAATAVDTANWYLEAQKAQNAADAAALKMSSVHALVRVRVSRRRAAPRRRPDAAVAATGRLTWSVTPPA